MARKAYSTGLDKTRPYFQKNRHKIQSLLKNPHSFEYAKTFGNAFYELEIMAFLEEFKIEKSPAYALEAMAFFKSPSFISSTLKRVGVEALIETQPLSRNIKDVFYVLCFFLKKDDNRSDDLDEIKKRFFFRNFLFHIFQLNPSGNIKIDYKDISIQIMKTRRLPTDKLRESFGEEKSDSGAYFKLIYNAEELITLNGKKTCCNLRNTFSLPLTQPIHFE